MDVLEQIGSVDGEVPKILVGFALIIRLDWRNLFSDLLLAALLSSASSVQAQQRQKIPVLVADCRLHSKTIYKCWTSGSCHCVCPAFTAFASFFFVVLVAKYFLGGLKSIM